MTMIIAYTWQDRIIMMADSRSSAKNDEGKMTDYSDEVYKIIPVSNRLAIGHSGLRKAYLGEGHFFDLNKITEHFLERNQQIITMVTGKQLLTGLVEMWNRTLKEKMGRNPFSLANRFSFLLAKFETTEGGVLKPEIHAYQSHFQKFNWGGNKAIIGDDEVYPIIKPYYETNTDNWTFEETIDFYKKGFAEVMEKVETVGGAIDIYVLDADPMKSFWLEHKPTN
ncbi:hypothetical protein [Lysinibacillus telephonicus]|uniref:hypothetical protein n=1 Tax=Lysinibacillus telephonicus TaxID=1714840 RepID=UPI0037D7CF0E